MISFALALAAAAQPAPRGDPMIGTWMNRRETVAVQTSRCGANLCGRVVWAAPSAQQAAAAGGTPHLVGTMLMRDFRRVGPGLWQGEVFVADLGQTAPAEMTIAGPGEIEINGCLGSVICKRQVWHKATPPR